MLTNPFIAPNHRFFDPALRENSPELLKSLGSVSVKAGPGEGSSLPMVAGSLPLFNCSRISEEGEQPVRSLSPLSAA